MATRAIRRLAAAAVAGTVPLWWLDWAGGSTAWVRPSDAVAHCP